MAKLNFGHALILAGNFSDLERYLELKSMSKARSTSTSTKQCYFFRFEKTFMYVREIFLLPKNKCFLAAGNFTILLYKVDL